MIHDSLFFHWLNSNDIAPWCDAFSPRPSPFCGPDDNRFSLFAHSSILDSPDRIKLLVYKHSVLQEQLAHSMKTYPPWQKLQFWSNLGNISYNGGIYEASKHLRPQCSLLNSVTVVCNQNLVIMENIRFWEWRFLGSSIQLLLLTFLPCISFIASYCNWNTLVNQWDIQLLEPPSSLVIIGA